MKNKKIKSVVTILSIILLSTVILEYSSYRYLINRAFIGGHFSAGSYMHKVSFWNGGLDNNPEHLFRGYDDSLKLGDVVYFNQYGMIHGDGKEFQIEKEHNTIRIILTGGSGLFGSLQTWSVIKMFNYPEGQYDYKTSIAGKLKFLLNTKYPNYNWEVINAGVVMHIFSQSHARYYEKFRRLNPDIIINMDGSNDYQIFEDLTSSIQAQKQVLAQQVQALTTEAISNRLRLGYTITALSIILTPKSNVGIYSLVNKVLLFFLKDKKLPTRDYDTSENFLISSNYSDTLSNFNLDTTSVFSPITPFLKQSSEEFLWHVSSYFNQLKHDQVYGIFCFQPVLSRKGFQKKLSDKEKAMYDFLDYDKPNQIYAPDNISQLNLPKSLQDSLIKIGSYSAFIKKYVNEHFINEYISPALDSTITSHGGLYIDLGERMKILDKNLEFYMDYTHTTPAGNEFIAKEMMKGVEKYLEHKYNSH